MSLPLTLAIPVYQAEQFLPETLASLQVQGEHVRWWLQDAASTDRTVEIAREYARPGDTIVIEPDGGQADALNRAFGQMGGEIVGFINGDDCLTPGAAELVLRTFAEHPEADLVVGGIEWINADGVVTGRHQGEIENVHDVLDIYRVWWREKQWVQPEVFYRRSLWERVGGFDTRYHLAFDFDFWVRCFLAGARVHHLAQPLARFRLHAAQKSSASAQAASEIRDIVGRYLEAADITPTQRALLRARLSYDCYQAEGEPASRAPFWQALLRQPLWLTVPEVQQRLQTACRRSFLAQESRP